MYSSGEKFQGEWKDNTRNGAGKYYNKRGEVLLDGTWANDEFQEKPAMEEKPAAE